MQIEQVDMLPPEARAADFSFEISAAIIPPYEAVPFHVTRQPPRRKEYGLGDALFGSHDGNERILFAARSQGDLAGYVSASRDWTGCTLIDDLAVAAPFRRSGVARALMDAIAAWTVAQGRNAIRLETQATNVAACRFYQHYGFELGGYDRLLYRELGDDRDDIALFWYFTLAEARSQTRPAVHAIGGQEDGARVSSD